MGNPASFFLVNLCQKFFKQYAALGQIFRQGFVFPIDFSYSIHHRMITKYSLLPIVNSPLLMNYGRCLRMGKNETIAKIVRAKLSDSWPRIYVFNLNIFTFKIVPFLGQKSFLFKGICFFTFQDNNEVTEARIRFI